jgi:peptidoglycan/xylan/chitin deacetylase (PgdA/CDA1 family)
MRCEFTLTRRNFLKLWGMATLYLLLPRMSRAAIAGIPVLLYHDISGEFNDAYTMSPSNFAAQMEWLYESGYSAVSLRDIGAGHALPERTVAITFDDGYASFMDYAFPLFQQYGFKSTINVIGEYVGTYMEMHGKRPMLSWDEYRHLVGSGLIDLGCHTYGLHRYSSRGVTGVTDSVLADDLRLFQETIRKQTGSYSQILAWPYGLYTRKSIEIAADGGFNRILTSRRGLFQFGGDLLEIPRRNISNSIDLVSFRRFVGEGA